jgi:hypothetical protein
MMINESKWPLQPVMSLELLHNRFNKLQVKLQQPVEYELTFWTIIP